MKILMKVENVALTMAQSSQLKQRLSSILDGRNQRRPVTRWTVAALFVTAGAVLPLLASAQSPKHSTLAREVAFSSAAVSAYSSAASVGGRNLELKRLSSQTFQLVQSSKDYSFDTGRYYVHARAQQTDGLYRGIQIYSRRKDPMVAEETISAYARFGRRDKSIANRWILGDVVLLAYDEAGAYKRQSIVKHLIIDMT